MARRTLSSTWRNYERLVRQYDKTERADEEKLQKIFTLTEKANKSPITDALGTLFVEPYEVEDVCINLVATDNGARPDWQTRFCEDSRTLDVCVLGVFDFIRRCAAAVESLDKPEARRSFQHYRYHAYLAELSKLPSQLFLFLLILREVASIKHITDVEKKGGEIEVAEGEEYLKLLWAFKELESFYQRSSGVDLRAEYQILWLESDWFVGK